jgi:hypothetical protein
MKRIPQQKGTSSRLPLKETITLIKEILGENITTGFDDSCISDITFEWNLGVCEACVYYYRIKVTSEKGSSLYWPIQLEMEDIQPQAAKEMLSRKLT